MRRFAWEPPVIARQFLQWQVWPLGLSKRPGWVIVRVIEPQRHVPLMPSEKLEIGCEDRSPVRVAILGDVVKKRWFCFRTKTCLSK